MELRFDAMLCSNLGNKNYDTGHMKCLRGPQVPTPAVNQRCKSTVGLPNVSIISFLFRSKTSTTAEIRERKILRQPGWNLSVSH